MSERELQFPYLARQMNGPIAMAIGKGIDYVYSQDNDIIEFLSNFNLDNLTGKWLDALGKLIGIPRYYIDTNTYNRLFVFEDVPAIGIDGEAHGFSTVNDSQNGGHLSDGKPYYDTNISQSVDEQNLEPISDALYRTFIKGCIAIKYNKSIKSLEECLIFLMKSHRFVIEYDQYNDINIKVSASYYNDIAVFQDIMNRTYRYSPKVYIQSSLTIEQDYLIPYIESLIEPIIPVSYFSATYAYSNKRVVITITIDSTYEEKKKR